MRPGPFFCLALPALHVAAGRFYRSHRTFLVLSGSEKAALMHQRTGVIVALLTTTLSKY
jgi:hypothetical protein